MPDSIAPISLPADERAVILDLWGDPQAFEQWQRDVLAAEVQARAEQRAAVQARQIMTDAADQVRDAMPSLFESVDG